MSLVLASENFLCATPNVHLYLLRLETGRENRLTRVVGIAPKILHLCMPLITREINNRLQQETTPDYFPTESNRKMIL